MKELNAAKAGNGKAKPKDPETIRAYRGIDQASPDSSPDEDGDLSNAGLSDDIADAIEAEVRAKTEALNNGPIPPEQGGYDHVMRDDDQPEAPPLGEAIAPDEDRFKLVAFDDIDIDDDPEYIVDGLIARAAMIVVWGPPKCGKSYWLYDLLMHVALGWRYRDRDVEKGVAVYLALEGGSGFKKRIAAFKKHHAGRIEAGAPFYLVTVPFNLVNDHPALIKAVRAKLGSAVNPAVIALDTLNRSITGSESKDADMTAFVRASDILRDSFGCAVVVVHHCGHDDARMRGFSGLPAVAGLRNFRHPRLGK